MEYAFWNGTAWECEVVRDMTSLYGWSGHSLVLDENDVPHLALHAKNFDRIEYAIRNGTNDWNIQTVEVGNFAVTPISMDFDSHGAPHIAYIFWQFPRIWAVRHATLNDGTWVAEEVDNEAGLAVSLKVDAQDRIHLAYEVHTTLDLRYALWNGTDWEIETVRDDVNTRYVSLDVDPCGGPHIVYHRDSYGNVYLRKEGDTWALRRLSYNAGTGFPYDITVDNSGSVHIVHCSNDEMFYSYLPGPLPGDANRDGKVDGADLAIWQENYDPLGFCDNNTFCTGDWDFDGDIDGADLALWQENYAPLGYLSGSPPGPLTLSSDAAPIPEPATLSLLAIAGLVLVRRKSRTVAKTIRR